MARCQIAALISPCLLGVTHPKAKFSDQLAIKLCMFNLSDDMSHDEGPVPGGADSGDQVAGDGRW